MKTWDLTALWTENVLFCTHLQTKCHICTLSGYLFKLITYLCTKLDLLLSKLETWENSQILLKPTAAYLFHMSHMSSTEAAAYPSYTSHTSSFEAAANPFPTSKATANMSNISSTRAAASRNCSAACIPRKTIYSLPPRYTPHYTHRSIHSWPYIIYPPRIHAPRNEGSSPPDPVPPQSNPL